MALLGSINWWLARDFSCLVQQLVIAGANYWSGQQAPVDAGELITAQQEKSVKSFVQIGIYLLKKTY